MKLSHLASGFVLGSIICSCLAATARAADQPAMTWNPADSTNYTVANRPASHAITHIVIHITEGSYAGAINWFKNPASNVSAHYVISKQGAITQMVAHKDIAWQAGNAFYNQHGIGIEHEGVGTDPNAWTEAMLDASARLVAWIAETYAIPVDADHIKIHKEVNATACPGSYFDRPAYINRVNTILGGAGAPPPAPTNLQAVTYLNGNSGSADMSWNAAPGAQGYWIDLAETADDLQNMTGTFTNWHAGANTSVTWNNLKTGARYHWRVYAYNAAGGTHGYPAGETWVQPGVAASLSASGFEAGGSTGVNFSWSPPDGASGIWLDIAQSAFDLANMTGSYQNVLLAGNATGHQWTNLPASTTFHWRIYPHNAGGGTHTNAATTVTTPALAGGGGGGGAGGGGGGGGGQIGNGANGGGCRASVDGAASIDTLLLLVVLLATLALTRRARG